MLHLGWIALVVFAAWRIAFAVLKGKHRRP